MASAADWIAAMSTMVGAITAIVAAWIGLDTFKSQRTASDVNVALNIFNEINRYWDRHSSDPADYSYNMGQILAQFEIAASMFNSKILSSNATQFLGDHIVEVFSQLRSSLQGEELIMRCCSSDKTFVELQKFVKARMPQALNALEFRSRRGDK